MFRFEPIEQEENKKLDGSTLRPGIASFKILTAYDKDKDGGPLTSKNGNAMLKLELLIKDCEDHDGIVYDYIINTVKWKINQLCKSLDKEVWSRGGSIPVTSLKGLQGQCELKEDLYNGEVRMKIGSYIARAKAETVNAVETQWPDDDEVPF